MAAIDELRHDLLESLMNIINKSSLSDEENTNIALNFCTNLLVTLHIRGKLINLNGVIESFKEMLVEKLSFATMQESNETNDLH